MNAVMNLRANFLKIRATVGLSRRTPYRSVSYLVKHLEME